MLYPIKFNPIYKEIIWGGKNISKYFSRSTPFEKTAESWELCERPEGMSIVQNGFLAGTSLEQLIEQYGEKLLGTECVKKYGKRFPLLVKLIDANDKLSVQVHPDDEYARKNGEENGKNELWYIIDAKPDAKLVYGLKDSVTKETFEQAINSGTVEETLNVIPVNPSDALYIPAGTVHAILDGILIAEIQQSSNTTYRIYDWGRIGKDGKPRELHVKRALDVINFNGKTNKLNKDTGEPHREILKSRFFNIDEVKFDTGIKMETDGTTFTIIMNLVSPVTIKYADGETPLERGDTVLIPACLGKYAIEGQSKVLMSWI